MSSCFDLCGIGLIISAALTIPISIIDLALQPRSSGQDLYTALMERLGVLEADYFDLEYLNKDGHLVCLLIFKLMYASFSFMPNYPDVLI